MKLEGITRHFGQSILKTKSNSPHIFFALGLVGVIGGAVLASRATLKLEDTLDEIKTECEEVKTLASTAEKRLPSYSEQDYLRDMGFVITKSTVKVVKLYGPAMIVGGLGIAALTGSHVQLTKRNAALTAVLAALSKAYDEYRTRVKDELGVDRERELYHGVKEVEVEVDGTIETIKVIDPYGRSPYARCFDVFSAAWQKDPELNRIFLQTQERYANQKLRVRGHMMLNDIYDLIGIDRTAAGAVCGWVYDYHDQSQGDNYITFDINNALNERFLEGSEPACWLDFNVDGVVYEQIGKVTRR